MNYVFSPLQLEQCEKVCQLEKDIFHDCYSLDSIISDCKNPLKLTFVLTDKEKNIVAYCMLSTVLDEANIDRIAVRADLRKNGIGSYMLDNVINYCKNNDIKMLNLEVRPSNHAGISLYQSHGFKKVGERKKYYSDNNEDAFLYTLIIEG